MTRHAEEWENIRPKRDIISPQKLTKNWHKISRKEVKRVLSLYSTCSKSSGATWKIQERTHVESIEMKLQYKWWKIRLHRINGRLDLTESFIGEFGNMEIGTLQNEENTQELRGNSEQPTVCVWLKSPKGKETRKDGKIPWRNNGWKFSQLDENDQPTDQGNSVNSSRKIIKNYNKVNPL